jgi:hypothetical protein
MSNSGQILREYKAPMSIELWLIAGGLAFLYFLIAKKRTYDPRDVPGIPKPRYDKDIHKFSVYAISEGKDMYEKIIQLNTEHPDQEIVKAYASLNEDYAKFLTMYFASGNLSNVKDVKKQSYYWAAWSQELQKREEDMRLTHKLVPYESSKE